MGNPTYLYSQIIFGYENQPIHAPSWAEAEERLNPIRRTKHPKINRVPKHNLGYWVGHDFKYQKDSHDVFREEGKIPSIKQVEEEIQRRKNKYKALLFQQRAQEKEKRRIEKRIKKKIHKSLSKEFETGMKRLMRKQGYCFELQKIIVKE